MKLDDINSASQLWQTINDGLFAAQDTENDHTMNLVAVGLDIFRLALQKFPNRYIEFVFTGDLLWHLSFALKVHKSIANEQIEFRPDRFRNQPAYAELVKRPSVLKYAEMSDMALRTIYDLSAKDADIACSMLLSISKNKDIFRFSHISRLVRNIYQPHATSTAVLKWTMRHWKLIKNSSLHPLAAIPTSLTKMRALEQDRLLEFLKVLFIHSCYTTTEGEEDETSQLRPDEYVNFRERFFDILNQFAKEELTYYESGAKTTLTFPWSAHLYDFFKNEFEGKENVKCRTERVEDTLQVQQVLEGVEQQLGTIVHQLEQLGGKDLRVIAFRILVQRCLLFLLADPEFIDLGTAKDIAQFVDIMYLKKDVTIEEKEEGEEEMSTIAVMTDFLIYLSSRTDHLDELIRFLVVQHKYDMDNQALALLTETIQNILVEETDNKMDDETDDDMMDMVDDDEEEEEEDDEDSDDENESSDDDDDDDDASSNGRMDDDDAVSDSSLTDADMFAQDDVLAELIKEKMRAIKSPGMPFKHFGGRLASLLGMLYKYKPKTVMTAAAAEKNKRCKILIYVNLLRMLLNLQSFKIAAELSGLLHDVYEVVQKTESAGSIAALTAEKFDNRTRVNMDAKEKLEISKTSTNFLTEDDFTALIHLLDSVVNTILTIDVRQRQPFINAFVFLVSVLYYQNNDKVRETVITQFLNWIFKDKPGHLESEKPSLLSVSRRLPFIHAEIMPRVLQFLLDEKNPVKTKYILVNGLVIPSLGKPNSAYVSSTH